MQLCAASASDPAFTLLSLRRCQWHCASSHQSGILIIGTEVGRRVRRDAPAWHAPGALALRRWQGLRRVVPSLPASPSQPARGQTKRDGREGEKRTGARAHRSLRSYSPTLAVEQSCREQSRGELGFTVCAQPDTRNYRSSEAGHMQAVACFECMLVGSTVV